MKKKTPDSAATIITGMDIGTQSIKLVTAKTRPGASPRVLHVETVPSEGVYKGVITDFPAFEKVILQAAEKTEKELAKIKIKNPFQHLYASLSGWHLKGKQNDAQILLDPKHGVGKNDIEIVKRNARNNMTPQGDDHVLVVSLHQSFFVDGEMRPNPLNILGQKLQTRYWCVYADAQYKESVELSMKSRGLEISRFILSSLASASVLANESLCAQGVLVVDIGAGSTDFVAYHKKCVYCTGSIPVGGNHISYDLCRALGIKRAGAEQLKHAAAGATANENPDMLKAAEIVIRERVREIFNFIKLSLDEKKLKFFSAGVILTGGVARLRGIEQIAAQTLGMDVRKREFPKWAEDSLHLPEYSVALGLVELGQNDLQRQPPPKSFFGKLRSMFR
jgi:cell division protein FtsA